MKPWIDNRITELIEMEDEVVNNLVISYLEEQQEQGKNLCPKKITVHLAGKTFRNYGMIICIGFLGESSMTFMTELWEMLLDAQESKFGIPQKIIDMKKEEYSLKKELIKEKREQLEKIKQREQGNPHIAEELKEPSKSNARGKAFKILID